MGNLSNKARHAVGPVIPWAQPDIGQPEIEAVLDVFSANWLSMGPKVAAFEAAMARYLGVPYAIAVSNGTVALDLALKALGVGPGDEVIVPAMTYFATAAVVSERHAIPVFVDIESESYNLDSERIEHALSPLTKAIVFIDYGGNPANIAALQAVADRHGIPLLQDGAQSLGGQYHGRPLGAQTRISTMSFHVAKVMTTVEGGMIFTHDGNVADELYSRRNQGESAKYVHSLLGTNARMTDISAAIGLTQLGKLDRLLSERQRVARRYDGLFAGVPHVAVCRCKHDNSRSAYFFYPLLTAQREKVAARLGDARIETRIAYPMPVYEQPVYAKGTVPFRRTHCPVAVAFTQRVINLPIYPSLTDQQVDFVGAELLAAANDL